MNTFDNSNTNKFCIMKCKVDERRFKRKGIEMEYKYVVVKF